MNDFDAPKYVDFTVPSPLFSPAEDFFNQIHIKHEHNRKIGNITMRRKLGFVDVRNEEKEKNEESKEIADNLSEETSQINFEDTTTTTRSKQLPKSRVGASFTLQPNDGEKNGSKKKATLLTKNANHHQVKRHMNIMNQRRTSISKIRAPTLEHDEQNSSKPREKSKTESSELHSLSDENTLLGKTERKKPTNDKLNKSKQLPKSKIATSVTSQSNDDEKNRSIKRAKFLTGNARHRQVQRRMSILNQRLINVSKTEAPTSAEDAKDKKTSAPYVSLAEAVLKFQRATPERFHTIRSNKARQIGQLRKMSLNITRAHPPALIVSENRNRPGKANPLRKDNLTRSASIKKVEKKMATKPQPFQLTKTKKEQQLSLKSGQEINQTNSSTKKTISNQTNHFIKNPTTFISKIPIKISPSTKTTENEKNRCQGSVLKIMASKYKLSQNQFKANPSLRKDILTRSVPIRKAEKTMMTKPQPFQFTKTKKEQQPPLKSDQGINQTINSSTKKIIFNQTNNFIKNPTIFLSKIPIKISPSTTTTENEENKCPGA